MTVEVSRFASMGFRLSQLGVLVAAIAFISLDLKLKARGGFKETE